MVEEKIRRDANAFWVLSICSVVILIGSGFVSSVNDAADAAERVGAMPMNPFLAFVTICSMAVAWWKDRALIKLHELHADQIQKLSESKDKAFEEVIRALKA